MPTVSACWHCRGVSGLGRRFGLDVLRCCFLVLTGLRSVPATVASGFLNLIPVFGIATAYVFLGECLTLTQWAGATIILLSVLALLMWSAPTKASVAID